MITHCSLPAFHWDTISPFLWMFFLRVCRRGANKWTSRGNSSKPFSVCKCNHLEQVSPGHREQCVYVCACESEFLCSQAPVFLRMNVSPLHSCAWLFKREQEWHFFLFHALQVCDEDNFQPLHKKIPSSQIVYNLTGYNVENYLVATANDFIRNRWMQLVFTLGLWSYI